MVPRNVAACSGFNRSFEIEQPPSIAEKTNRTMADTEMPLLLDGGMSVDGAMDVMGATMALDDVDLFGDPVIENPLSLPQRVPSSKQLQQRLDELRARGCCQ